jgi:hypothetical protein
MPSASDQGKTVASNVHKTALLGELIAAAFDGAARYTTDPQQVSRIAASAVMHLLMRGAPRQWTEGKPQWPALA